MSKHLYDQVKTTLATDKEVKNIRHLNARIDRYLDNKCGIVDKICG